MYKILRTFLNMPKYSIFKAKTKSIFQRQLCSSTSKSPQIVYLLDEDDNNSTSSLLSSVNKYTYRTRTCGELTIKNVGQTVILCGWLEYQRMNKFVVVRDSYGETQLLIKDPDIQSLRLLQNVPFESIIRVKGTVLSRPKKMINKAQKTGEIEVSVEKLEILNKANVNLPFNIREFQKAKESIRMQYRYLDLRFPLMQRNLRVRSEMLMRMREFLVDHAKFVDVETPTLFKKTPGGAQEFIVPTRFPGQFYSLVQSPQQFKQMLMAGSIDRYFQIARCYRDEGARSDRQPEFTQLDIEMSFTDVEGVTALIEELLNYSWPKFLEPLPMKFPRISYKDALENYGSDQPDTSFEFKLRNCTNLINYDLKENFGGYYLIFNNEQGQFTKSIKEKNFELSKQYSKLKFVQIKMKSFDGFTTKCSKLLGEQVALKLAEAMNIERDSVVFLAYGDKKETLSLLGKIRLQYVDFLENTGLIIRKKGMHVMWITDFPLFEVANDGTLNSAHHPFTAPHPDDIKLLETDPLKVRALAYDLVLNGNEIGGGSIRIHSPDLQQQILQILKIDQSNLQHIVEMLASGCPPHGGIALGLDRLLSRILKTTSIRDVIAFPKTFEGRDPLSGAPSAITQDDMKLYHIKSTNDAK